MGELLIDFVSLDARVNLSEATRFGKKPGGAPANVACGLSRLGRSSAFLGKVGDDPFGDFLEDTLRSQGVSTRFLGRTDRARTTLAFVAVGPGGVPDFTFYRHPGADMLLDEDDVSEDLFQDCLAFHFGSISLIDSSPRKATYRALRAAEEKSLLISYDPNLRLSLWPDPETAHRRIREPLGRAHVVKISQEEWDLVTGHRDFEAGAEWCLSQGVRLVVQSMGPAGCRYAHVKGIGQLSGYSVSVQETTGAGDAFVAAMIHQLLGALEEPSDIVSLSQEKIRSLLDRANRAGAITCTGIGAIPSMPTWDQIEEFDQGRSELS